MAEIVNPIGYFTTMVQNSYKNEYRANDNFFNHISSVGDEHDIQQEHESKKPIRKSAADFIEQELCETSVENWLLLMENLRLHAALSKLPIRDVEFLFQLAQYRFNQTAYATDKGVRKQTVSKRFLRLKKKILENV